MRNTFSFRRDSVFIIAEAGVNHNGDLSIAKKLVDAAVHSGADAVKFQTFKTENVVIRSADKAEYQKAQTGSDESQFDMIKKLELDADAHEEIATHCAKAGIVFMSTPFDLESVDLLADRFNVPCLKIPSGEITNALLMLKVARAGKPMILSTGMSTLEDIEAALGVIAFGLCDNAGVAPSIDNFRKAWDSPEGRRRVKEMVCLLHCTTDYPARIEDVNLRALKTIADKFELPVGYSDHTRGIAIPIAAVAMGATVIEKHFTLDKNMQGPDHSASLEPDELCEMVSAIRQVEKAFGSADKKPGKSEQKIMAIARRSIVATRTIKKGEAFSPENISAKRPGTGISPIFYWDWIGRVADREYKCDDLIE